VSDDLADLDFDYSETNLPNHVEPTESAIKRARSFERWLARIQVIAEIGAIRAHGI
jgi:hypothetical protein